jgi:hypothetical protein
MGSVSHLAYKQPHLCHVQSDDNYSIGLLYGRHDWGANVRGRFNISFLSRQPNVVWTKIDDVDLIRFRTHLSS